MAKKAAKSSKAARKPAGAKKRKGARKRTSVAFAPAASFAAATAKKVDFKCSNPSCIVGITIGASDITFVGEGAAMLPPGTHTMFYRVQGNGAYRLTVTNATLSAPISSTAPDAGVRMLTV